MRQTGGTTASFRADGNRNRPAQAVFPAHLPGPDGGVRRAVRGGRLSAAQADRDRVHVQSGAQRPDHPGAGNRRGAGVSAGAAALSGNRLGEPFPPGRSRSCGQAAAGAAGADGGDPGQPHRTHGDFGADDARHSRFDRHPSRRGARHFALHDWSAGVPRAARHVLGPDRDGGLGRRCHPGTEA